MTSIVGGCLACTGVCKLFELLDKSARYLSQGVQQEPQIDRSACKRIFRVVANVLNIIGIFAVAVGMISMGGTMVTVAPQLAFFPAVQQAVTVALPYFAGALIGGASGLIIHQATR